MKELLDQIRKDLKGNSRIPGTKPGMTPEEIEVIALNFLRQCLVESLNIIESLHLRIEKLEQDRSRLKQ
jgi:hypothetical protein